MSNKIDMLRQLEEYINNYMLKYRHMPHQIYMSEKWRKKYYKLLTGKNYPDIGFCPELFYKGIPLIEPIKDEWLYDCT